MKNTAELIRNRFACSLSLNSGFDDNYPEPSGAYRAGRGCARTLGSDIRRPSCIHVVASEPDLATLRGAASLFTNAPRLGSSGDVCLLGPRRDVMVLRRVAAPDARRFGRDEAPQFLAEYASWFVGTPTVAGLLTGSNP